jgi:hypothetical protein
MDQRTQQVQVAKVSSPPAPAKVGFLDQRTQQVQVPAMYTMTKRETPNMQAHKHT